MLGCGAISAQVSNLKSDEVVVFYPSVFHDPGALPNDLAVWCRTGEGTSSNTHPDHLSGVSPQSFTAVIR